MPALTPPLGRTAVVRLHAYSHVRPDSDWWRRNAEALGVSAVDEGAVLLRVTGGGRQLTTIALDRFGTDSERQEIHIDYETRYRKTAGRRLRLAGAEFDGAVGEVASLTGPASRWSVQVDLEFPDGSRSVLPLPNPFVVGYARELRGFRLAGETVPGATFEIIVEMPKSELLHHVLFEDEGSLSDELVRRWIHSARAISASFLVGG
jgi:hypothetical protein